MLSRAQRRPSHHRPAREAAGVSAYREATRWLASWTEKRWSRGLSGANREVRERRVGVTGGGFGTVDRRHPEANSAGILLTNEDLYAVYEIFTVSLKSPSA